MGSRNRFRKRDPKKNNAVGNLAGNIIKNTVSTAKRAYNHRSDVLAIRQAEITGDKSKFTERQKTLDRPIGTKATLNGKPVMWAGDSYGYQSPESYKKLEKEGHFRAGDVGYQRVQSDMADGLLDMLGEENATKLAETIQAVTTAYEENTPGGLKDVITKGGELFSQINEQVSKTTGVSPQITGDVLTELATVGTGKAISATGKGALKIAKKTDIGSRVQELQRGLRGRSAKPLNTGGSVGASGAPTTPRQQTLRDADPYSGRRLDNDAADAIQKVSTKTAPKNTVNSKGQTRGAGKAKRAQQTAERNAVETRRQELLTQRDQNLRMIGYEHRAAARNPNTSVEQFGQQTRGQQAQQNVVRRREAADRNGRNTWRRREKDAQRRGGNGTGALPMENEYDTITNVDRVGIAGNAPGTVRAGSANARIQAPRNRNTVDGRRVINDSETRALRQREADNQARAVRRQRQQIDRNQEEIVLRNQIKGKPNRQKAAIKRAKDMGNGRLAEANYTRRAAAANETAERVTKKGLDGDDNPAGSLRRNGRIRKIVEEQWPEEFVDRKQMQAARPANTLKNGKKKVADTTRQAKANANARRAAKAKTRAERLKIGIKSRQGSGEKASAKYASGSQPTKGGKEGSRLFTPRNRAEAAQRAGSKLNAKHSEFGRNAVVAGGKAAYANTHTIGTKKVHDVGFRSTNLGKQYARDAERKLRGDKVTPKSKTKRRQDSAVIKNNLATVFSKVKEGDIVEATPIEGINGRNGRAKLYDRMSKGALKADADDNISSRRMADNKWKNLGETKEWDPEELRKDLDALTQPTQEQLRGKAVGGASQLQIKGKNVSGTKALSIDKQTRPKTNTRTNTKRQQQALSRISKFAKKNGMSPEEAIQYLQSKR